MKFRNPYHNYPFGKWVEFFVRPLVNVRPVTNKIAYKNSIHSRMSAAQRQVAYSLPLVVLLAMSIIYNYLRFGYL